MDKEMMFTSNHIFEYRMPIPKNQTNSYTNTVNLIPVGDAHFGSSQHCASEFNSDLKKMKADNASNLYLFTGDEIDDAASKERERLRNAKMHGNTKERMDMAALDVSYEFLDKVEFMKGRVVGMIQGNHHWQFFSDYPKHDIRAGMTTTEWLANKLNARFLGGMAIMRLDLKFEDSVRDPKHLRTPMIYLAMSHGTAGGKLVGNSINQVQDLQRIFPDASIFLMAHNHKRSLTPITCMRPLSGRGPLVVKRDTYWLARTGSYYETYLDDKENYMVKKPSPPGDVGTIKLELGMDRMYAAERNRIVNYRVSVKGSYL